MRTPADKTVANLAVAGQTAELAALCPHALFTSSPDADPAWPAGFLADGTALGRVLPGLACTAALLLPHLAAHMCAFGPVPCPNDAAACGRFPPAHLPAHLDACVQYACPFATVGCAFRGTATALAAHQAACPRARDPAVAAAGQLAAVQAALAALQAEVADLESRAQACEADTKALAGTVAECETLVKQQQQQQQRCGAATGVCLHARMCVSV